MFLPYNYEKDGTRKVLLNNTSLTVRKNTEYQNELNNRRVWTQILLLLRYSLLRRYTWFWSHKFHLCDNSVQLFLWLSSWKIIMQNNRVKLSKKHVSDCILRMKLFDLSVSDFRADKCTLVWVETNIEILVPTKATDGGNRRVHSKIKFYSCIMQAFWLGICPYLQSCNGSWQGNSPPW